MQAVCCLWELANPERGSPFQYPHGPKMSKHQNKKICLIHSTLQSLYCWVYFYWCCLRLSSVSSPLTSLLPEV